MQVSHFSCDARESHQLTMTGWGCGGMEQPDWCLPVARNRPPVSSCLAGKKSLSACSGLARHPAQHLPTLLGGCLARAVTLNPLAFSTGPCPQPQDFLLLPVEKPSGGLVAMSPHVTRFLL